MLEVVIFSFFASRVFHVLFGSQLLKLLLQLLLLIKPFVSLLHRLQELLLNPLVNLHPFVLLLDIVAFNGEPKLVVLNHRGLILIKLALLLEKAPLDLSKAHHDAQQAISLRKPFTETGLDRSICLLDFLGHLRIGIKQLSLLFARFFFRHQTDTALLNLTLTLSDSTS